MGAMMKLFMFYVGGNCGNSNISGQLLFID
jgi:hypothetical protein